MIYKAEDFTLTRKLLLRNGHYILWCCITVSVALKACFQGLSNMPFSLNLAFKRFVPFGQMIRLNVFLWRGQLKPRKTTRS